MRATVVFDTSWVCGGDGHVPEGMMQTLVKDLFRVL